MRHSLPPNPSHPLQPVMASAPPKKKVLRPSPSKSQAVGGDIPQLPLGDLTCAPVFGSVQPDSDVGLGLSVNEDGGLGATANAGEVEIAEDSALIRWHEKERVETEPEKILKAEGRYGIGVEPALPGKTEKEVQGDAIKVADDGTLKPLDGNSAVSKAESLPQDVDSLEPMRSPKHKWSFGSFDGLSSGPSSMRSRIPSYGDGSSHSSAPGENGGTNGYRYEGRGAGGSPPSGYGQRHYNEDRRGPNSDGGQYAPSFDPGMNAYGPRGSGGRRPGRGSRGGFGGGYGGHRGGQGYLHRGTMPVNAGYRGGPYAPPGPPPISTAYAQPMHSPQPPYDPGMAVAYPPPMGTVEYQPMDLYAMQSSMPPPTPGGSQQPLSAMENPYSSHPLQSPYHPYMFVPPTPSGYYAPYPYMAPYSAAPVPVNYAPQVYQQPGAMQAPPVPMPLTSPGYTLDPSRFYLLGQVCKPD